MTEASVKVIVITRNFHLHYHSQQQAARGGGMPALKVQNSHTFQSLPTFNNILRNGANKDLIMALYSQTTICSHDGFANHNKPGWNSKHLYILNSPFYLIFITFFHIIIQIFMLTITKYILSDISVYFY